MAYIAPGIDGNLWFTNWRANNIGRITPAGSYQEYVPVADIKRHREPISRLPKQMVPIMPGAALRGTGDD
jgi:streptogramin lyase